MHDPSAAGAPAAITTASAWPLTLPGPWPSATAEELERERLLEPARESDAGRQFARCFARWPRALDHIRLAALRALAANRPVDPNDPDVWRSRDEHAQAILRRHGVAKLSAGRLTLAAIGELIAGQAQADRDAGLDWDTIAVPPACLDEPLRRAHSRLAISLEDPAIYAHRADQRHALSRTLGVSGEQADDLSRWVLTHPDQFNAGDLRCWRIGSRTWLELCDEQLPEVDRVERPVGLFVVPGRPRARGVAADAGALARGDPAAGLARRDARARPALRRAPRRRRAAAARADQPPHAARRPEGVP